MWSSVAIVLGEVTAYRFGMAAWFLAAAAWTAAVFFLWKKREQRGSRRLVYGALLLLSFLSGAVRMEAEQRPDLLEMRLEAGKRPGVLAWGKVCSVSEKDGWYTLILSGASVMENGEVWRQKRLLVSADGKEVPAVCDVACGTELEVRGCAKALEEATNPGQFSYRLHYRGQGIRCRIQADEIRAGEKNGASLAVRQADALARFAADAFETLCETEDAGIFKAVLLGDKTGLSGELKERFEDSGIAHILAVSGLHISLIGLSLYGLLRRLGAGYGLAGSAAGLALAVYGLAAGYSPSVFRAVFMVLCSFLAAYLGRSYDLLSAMSLALGLLALESPFLLWSGGLQLSFGAVLAIGLEQELRGAGSAAESAKAEKTGTGGVSGAAGSLWESFCVSAGIQLYTLPVLLCHFFAFPPWGLLLNLIVIPLLSWAALSGILAVILYGGAVFFQSSFFSSGLGAFGEIFPKMAEILEMGALAAVGPGHYIFRLYDSLCRWSMTLPFARILAGRPEPWKILAYYLLLGWRYMILLRPGRGRCSSFAKAAAVTALAVFLLMIRPVHGFHVWFLDVGQGDGVFFQTEDAAILSDFGSTQDRKVGENRLVPFLESQGVACLDYVFVSHADSDHMNGILWLLEEEPGIRIKNLAVPAAARGNGEYERLLSAAARAGVSVLYMKQGDTIRAGDIAISCLNPPDPGPEEKNAHSLALKVSYRQFHMVLAGDIGMEQEEEMCRSVLAGKPEDSRIFLLKVPHHGSGHSSSAEFLKRLSPRVSILSFGKDNSYGHPDPEAVKRIQEAGSRIVSTEASGAIHVYTDGRRVKLRTFR